MSRKEPKYKLPEEFKYAPKDVKEAWYRGCELDEKIQDTSFNTIVLSDRHGEPLFINCNAVYAQNVKKMKKAGITDQKDFDLIEERSRAMKEIQQKKGACTRIFNGYMTGNKHSNVTEWKKQEILEQFGEYKNVDQVLDWMKDQGFSLQRGKLVDLYEANLDDIKDRRIRYLSRSRDTVLATETGRMEQYSYLYAQVLKQWEATKNKGYISEGRSILEQIRKEVKGDEIKITLDGKIDLTATIQANRSLTEIMQKIPVNLFIVSLVAGKKGVNPNDIMAQLTSSFYNRWNGFGIDQAEEDEEIKLPSHFIKNYDWGTIESHHRDKDEKAVNTLFNRKLERFFKREGIPYNNNPMDALNMLKKSCQGEAVTEIIDVKPLEIKLYNEEEIEKVSDAKERLKEILAIRRKQLKTTDNDE